MLSLLCPLLASTSFALPAAALARAPVVDGLVIGGRPYRRIERRVNAFTASAQEASALDADAFGGSVVVWQSRRQEEGTYGVYARRFSPSNTPLTGEVHVNVTTDSQQTDPAVAVDEHGVWFAWMSFGQDGDEGAIVARRFDSALAQASGEVLVNAGATAGHQETPVVASDDHGNAVVVWTTPATNAGAGENERWILARRLDPSGNAVGAAFRVDAAIGVRESLPCVAFDSHGRFTVAWARALADGRPAGVFVRRFDANGNPDTGEIEVSAQDGALHIEPTLDVAPDGDVVVAWFTAPVSTGDYTVVLRLLESREHAFDLGPQKPVETGTPGYTSGLGVGRAPAGNMVLAWSGFGDPNSESDLFGRLLTADGNAASEVFHVARVTDGHQRLQACSGARHVWLGAEGKMLFTWNGNADQGDASAAELTLLAPVDVDLSLHDDALPRVGALPGFAPVDAASPQKHVPPTFDASRRASRDQAGAELSVGGPDFGFLGITNTGWTPPDPHMSVGPDHIVLMTNGAIAYFQKDGTLDFQAQIEGAGGFWGALGTGGFVFDPETCYDPHSNRFMAMACERTGGQSFFLYAVSDDSNPNGTWFKYRFNVTAAGGADIDSPELAVDANWVYLCADFFTPGDKFLVHLVEKAPTLSGGVPIEKNLLITGNQSFGVPVTYGTPPNGAQYMIEALEAASNTQIRFHAIQNQGGIPTDTTVLVNVPVYQQPENPPQMGTTSRPETFESRFWSCVYRNGSIWATHHTGASRVVQRWYEIDMGNWPVSGTPTVVQQGDIDLGATVRTYFGSIWVDANDNAGMVVARSSPTEFISMARCFRRPGDPLGTMTPAVTVQSSTSPETSGRWGDYSSVGVDPTTPGEFWGHHEYRTGSWRTWVDLFGPCETPTNYCVAKLNSAGGLPTIGSTGEPSVGAGNFAVTVSNALPNKLGLLWFSAAPDSTPFAGGTRCVLPPLGRGGILQTNTSGFASIPHTLPLALLGSSRYFQIFTRDPQIPDGSNLSLTEGLHVVVCP